MRRFSRKSSQRFAEGMLLAALAATTTACGRHAETVDDSSPVLMSYADSVLTLDDVVSRIPPGLSEADSLEMFRRIADSWAEDMVLTATAEKNSQTLDRIDRLVEDYRNRLLVAEYLRNMVSSEAPDVTEAQVRRYYDINHEKMVLDEPLVRGIYIKMPASSGKLAEVRRLVGKATENAIDHLESYCLDEVAQYEYFGNRWIEWSGLSEQIPYRFPDPDTFLSSTKDFETSYGDSYYFLHIIDYVPSGSQMPYQYASAKIKEIIGKENSDLVRKKLMTNLYREAVGEGRLRTEGYDPSTGRILENKE